MTARLTLVGVTGVPECVACGACCFSQLERYVRVSGVDYERLGERTDELVSFDGHRAHLRMVRGRCAALVVDDVSKQFRCAAYEARPQTCRDLGRGSAECLAERDAKAHRALAALSAPRT